MFGILLTICNCCLMWRRTILDNRLAFKTRIHTKQTLYWWQWQRPPPGTVSDDNDNEDMRMWDDNNNGYLRVNDDNDQEDMRLSQLPPQLTMITTMAIWELTMITTRRIWECDHRELSASVRLLSSNVGRASDWQLLYSASTIQCVYTVVPAHRSYFS